MEQLLCTVQNPFLQITYLCRTLPTYNVILLFQFFVQVFWNLVLPASNSSELILLNRIIIKYYHTLFALKTQNCLDNFTLIITDLSIDCLLLVFIAKRLFGFYMAWNIFERNFRTFGVFLNVTLFSHLCFRMTELMYVVFLLYLTCCLISVQECTKLFRFKDAG